MSHSLNEVRALAVRAARGAGFDWGMAEEAGFAVRWLSGAGLPGAMLLAQRLRGQHDSEAGLHGACPLSVGVQISDRAHQYRPDALQALQAIFCPLLLMPFLSNVARQRGTTVSVNWFSQRLLVTSASLWWYRDGAFRLTLEGEFPEGLDPVATADVKWVLNDKGSHLEYEAPEAAQSQPRRAPLDSESHACLSLLAARTYAPATEESRRLGAGGADGVSGE